MTEILIIFCLCYKFSCFSLKVRVIIFSCVRKFFKKKYIKSETWADGRHFGILEVVTMAT